MTNLRLRCGRFWSMPVAALVLWLAGISAVSGNEIDFGSHIVHFNVINTTFLSPEVARAYDVRRSSNRALVNVAVMQRGPEGMTPVTARISGQAVNLNLQSRSFQFREVQDGGAIYHLAEVPVRAGEVLDFQLRVVAEGRPIPMDIRFRQAFFAD